MRKEQLRLKLLQGYIYSNRLELCAALCKAADVPNGVAYELHCAWTNCRGEGYSLKDIVARVVTKYVEEMMQHPKYPLTLEGVVRMTSSVKVGITVQAIKSGDAIFTEAELNWVKEEAKKYRNSTLAFWNEVVCLPAFPIF